mgnify:CR=1 FL=1
MTRLSTEGVRLDDLHFYWLHLRFLFLGLVAMFAVSLAPTEAARRGAVLAGGVLLAQKLTGGVEQTVTALYALVNVDRLWLDPRQFAVAALYGIAAALGLPPGRALSSATTGIRYAVGS